MKPSNWHPLVPSQYAKIPAELHSWLIDTGSLTAKLRSVCGEFSVQLLKQSTRSIRAHEVNMLELNENDQLIDREVHLYCDDTPVVYARSMIPLQSVADRFENLGKMGEKPLGEKIFSDPQLSRSPMEWTELTAEHYLFTHAISNVSEPPTSIFGRRSLFYGAAKPILISEFFLPEITKLK